MLNNLPEDLLNIILNLVIEPYNNNYWKIKNIFNKSHKISTYLEAIKNKKLICYYCKEIFEKNIFIKNGGYCKIGKKPICEKHFYICTKCNQKHDFYSHSFLNNSCLMCC